MASYHFTLIVEGRDLQAEPWPDRLFEAGCDDATVSRTEGVQYLDFNREADSFEEAFASALRDIEQAGDVEILEARRDRES